MHSGILKITERSPTQSAVEVPVAVTHSSGRHVRLCPDCCNLSDIIRPLVVITIQFKNKTSFLFSSLSSVYKSVYCNYEPQIGKLLSNIGSKEVTLSVMIPK